MEKENIIPVKIGPPRGSSSEGIPLFAESVKCGFPSPAADYKEDGLDFNELLVANKSATYCLRVSGHSMEGRGISPGDILVVDRSVSPRSGDVIVAALDGGFTVKTLVRNGRGKIVLKAANVDYPDREIRGEEELFCFGVVTFCLKPFRPVRTMNGGGGPWWA